MKRFQFRLASILSIRRRVEESRTRVLALAAARETAEAHCLAGARQAAFVESGALIARVQEGAIAPAVRAHADDVVAHRHAAVTSTSRLAERHAETDAARAKLVHAARDRRALERLEEARRADYVRHALEA